jgi:hypothetical protein
MRYAFIIGTCAALVGCNAAGDKPAEPSTSTAAQTATASAAPTVAAPQPRKLDPLPLTLVLPDDVTVEKASENSVFVGDGDAKLRVRPLAITFEQAKKEACDPIVCKLVRWVKEDKELAVAEWSGMLSGFRALRPVEVGGKQYLCDVVGTTGAKSPEEAEKIVAQCTGLAPLDAAAVK